MTNVHSSRLRSKIFSVAAIRGASAVFAFALTWLIAHYLSLDQLGSFAFALLTVQLVSALSLLGIDSLLLRLMMKALAANKQGLAAKYINEAFAAATLMALPGVLVCGAIAAAVILVREDLLSAGQSLVIMAPAVLFSAISRICAGILRGHGKVTLSQVIDGTLPSVVALAGLLISLLAGWQVFLVPVYYLLGAALSAGMGLLLTHSELRPIRQIYSPGIMARTMRFVRASLPIQSANVANYLTDWTATAALAIWMPLSAMAIYRVVSQIGTVFVLAVSAFEIPVSTAILSAYLAGDRAQLRRIISSTRWLMIGSAALPVLAVFAYAGPILQLVFKIDSTAAVWALRVILIGQLVNIVTGPVGSALVMLGGARQLVRISWSVLIVMLVMSVILTPWQGVLGVCIAAATSLSMRNILNYHCVNRRIVYLDRKQDNPRSS